MAKKTPMRKCVLSGEMKPKKDMVRIVRNPDKSVAIDPTGKKMAVVPMYRWIFNSLNR